MKRHCFTSYSFFALIGLVLSPLAVVHASFPPADSVHFCTPFDCEQWRSDHPHPAAKRLALDVGEPRTVRLLYFLPNDRPYRAEVVQWIKKDIRKAQTFFAEQMQAHGYGNKTFRFETDAQGEPLVHRVDGQLPDSHYFDKTSGRLIYSYGIEMEQAFDHNENIYVRYRDFSYDPGWASALFRETKKGGTVELPARRGSQWEILAHELAHAFGLHHDFRDGAYILSYGGASQFPDARDRDRISACTAEFLSVHPYFNSAIPIEESSPPTIELISPTEYPAGLKSVSIQFEVSDAEGLHQVLFHASPGVGSAFATGGLRACRALKGERNAVVVFDYDGSWTAATPRERPISSLTDPLHLIGVTVVDRDGNINEIQFDLTKTVPSEDLYTLTKISGDKQQRSVGTALAEPFVVSVLDLNGAAFAGVVVTFAVTAGGGTLSATTVTTDANGRARSTLTLGPDPGMNTVAATVAGLEPVTFTATAVEQTHSLTKVSGDGQQGPASTQLAEPFVVSVLDQGGSPLAGVAVTFAVTAGEGLLSSTTDANPCTIEESTSSITSTTDANGQAAARLTLGSQPGTNTVEATVEGLEPETFTATATEQAMPHSLTKVCGDSQEGTAIVLLDEPLVVFVSDEEGAAMAGVVVSFAVTAGGGTLSDTTGTTDANGRAATRLTLGIEAGTNAVAATVEGLEPVTFTATAQESPFASLFDLFKSGKRVALPDRPQLAQNAPNPFNSQTVLAYFLLEPGPVRLEIFTLTGQRVAVLHQGPQQAGYHRLYWDGRDAAGRPVASGAYLYRLVTDEAVLTRKLILLR